MSDIVIKENALDDGRLVGEGYISITTTLPKAKLNKFYAFMHSDTWEQAEALRQSSLQECVKSLEVALKWALHHDCSGARVFATLLSSLYNGQRVKMDMSELSLLDGANFEHAMNVIRLCMETRREPHSFFVNGNTLFEKMISVWRLEKVRRRHS